MDELIIGGAIIGLVGIGALIFFLRPKKKGTSLNQESIGQTANKAPTSDPVTELKIADLKVGSGAKAASGSQVTVHYTGWLNTGKKFDSSFDRNQPFKFRIGEAKVIRGWEQGVSGMLIGGKRRLTIPPKLGYGSQGTARIPPRSTLIFDIELLNVE